MTKELEKQFFDTFGIEPKHNDGCKLADKYWANKELADEYITFDNYMNSCCTHGDSGACFSTCEYAYDDVEYPQITDRILLELICILRNSYYVSGENIEVLKERVLSGCIKFRYNLVTNNETIKQQVRTLFGGND